MAMAPHKHYFLPSFVFPCRKGQGEPKRSQNPHSPSPSSSPSAASDRTGAGSPNPRKQAAAEMVYYALLVGAELDGLTNLQPSRGCDDPNFPYYLKLKCENCGEVTAKSTYVTLSEQVELPKGHGTAHLVQKCKLCGRDGTIVMIPGQGTPLTIEQSQKEEMTCLMVFDCRGYEPVEFSFGAGWKAESVHGTPFEIDCSEGEFSEYDEKGECPVELSKLQSTFKVVKKPERGGKIKFV